MSNIIRIQIRFSDVDMMGHVNNAVYLNYFETARMHFLTKELGSKWDWVRKGIVLRKNEIEYLEPVMLNDIIDIEVKPETIGNTSFTLVYTLRVGDKVKCKGESRLVCYDYEERTTHQVYDEFKKAFDRYLK